ncbi:MAG: acyltransferase [Fimbriimonadaceae bacterium]|jgi:peptidoglycan/LPS O-acetylase OafA/YrhL|nr:acyltransferase [Fimbriimonadaceae bacterium]
MIRPLTGLRGLAALWVVLIHIEALHWPHLPELAMTLLSSYGILPVVFFFALSGFILAVVYLPRTSKGSFDGEGTEDYAWARIARILPLYLVSVFPATVLHAIWMFTLNNQMPFTAETRRGAGFFHTEGIGFNALLRSNVPAWTLSAELIFYLLFPFVLGKLAQKESGVLLRGIAKWLGFYLAIQIFLGSLQLFAGTPWAEIGYGVGQFGSPIFIPIFVSGVILGILHHRGELPIWRNEWSSLLYAIVFVASAWVVNPTGSSLPASLNSALLAPLFLLVIMAGTSTEGSFNRFFSSPPLEFLGRASYAIYITHWPVKEILQPYLMTTSLAGQPMVVGALVLLASVVVGIAAHLWIEGPAYKWVSTALRERVSRAKVAAFGLKS